MCTPCPSEHPLQKAGDSVNSEEAGENHWNVATETGSRRAGSLVYYICSITTVQTAEQRKTDEIETMWSIMGKIADR